MGCVDASGRPAPCQKPLTYLQRLQLAYAAGFRGSALVNIVAISEAESSGIGNAVNGPYQGILQINPANFGSLASGTPGGSWGPGLTVLDPRYAFQAAYRIYQQQGFCPWQTWSGQGCSGKGYVGTYSKFTAAVQALVNKGVIGDPNGVSGPQNVPILGGIYAGAGAVGNTVGGAAGAVGNAVSSIPDAIGNAVSTALLRGGLILAGLVGASIGLFLLAQDEKSRQLRSIFAGSGKGSGGASPETAAATEEAV